MNKKRFTTTAAILIALPLSFAHVAVSAGRSVRVAEESRQTLKEIQASATAVETEADQLRVVIENSKLIFDSGIEPPQPDRYEGRSQQDGPGDEQPGGGAQFARAVGTSGH